MLEGLFPPNHAKTPVFRRFLGRKQLQIYGYAAVANGKKENRKRLLFCCRDKAINKVVNAFVRMRVSTGSCDPGPGIRGTKSHCGDTLLKELYHDQSE